MTAGRRWVRVFCYENDGEFMFDAYAAAEADSHVREWLNKDTNIRNEPAEGQPFLVLVSREKRGIIGTTLLGLKVV